MIKDFTPRLYQQTIFGTCAEKNTLVILPTGLGKTYVFLMLAMHYLNREPKKKILFLGPTRPLISQYKQIFLKHTELKESELSVFTGHVRPEKRALLWKSSKIIFSTPQGLENDIISENIDLNEVSLLGFDEAHRATGNYAYVWIAKQYQKARNGRILALTASPGSDVEKIHEVCTNLHIEAVEVRTDKDPDVSPYIKEVSVSWIYVELPEVFKEIKVHLDKCYGEKIQAINDLDILQVPSGNLSKKDLLGMQAQLRSEVISGNKQFEILRGISIFAEIMKLQHASELLETQGSFAAAEFMEAILKQARTSKVKAVVNLSRDMNFRSALVKIRSLVESGIEHPKMLELKKIVKEEIKKKGTKLIVFSQYRDSIHKIVDILNSIDGVSSKMFVGQAKKKGTGLSQKKQIEMLSEFRDGKFNVIVMSSVGEEGLDIPSVDGVIFYEPVPSAIRTIQRRGRTGRQDEGKVIVLVTKGTRDEGYRWSAHRKERRMHDILKRIKTTYSAPDPAQRSLGEYDASQDGLVIYADYREKGNGIIKKLVDKGVKIKLEQLEIGDYLLSSRVCIEYKTVPDFVDSLVDKRLLEQLKHLREYERPLIIIQGKEDIYSQRNIHHNAINGMLASITVGYGIPVLQTKSEDETLYLLIAIARREQIDENRDFTRHSLKPSTLREQQEYVVSSIPGIGPVLSKPLLNHFKSVKDIINATKEELQDVEFIGKKKAGVIWNIANSKYGQIKKI